MAGRLCILLGNNQSFDGWQVVVLLTHSQHLSCRRNNSDPEVGQEVEPHDCFHSAWIDNIKLRLHCTAVPRNLCTKSAHRFQWTKQLYFFSVATSGISWKLLPANLKLSTESVAPVSTWISTSFLLLSTETSAAQHNLGPRFESSQSC